MDAAKKKAFRAKLNAQRKEKRIDSPLVRYNESDQPVCRICNVVLKSEALWDAHQASRKHHEAIENFKASAAGKTHVKNVEGHTESARSEHEEKAELHDKKLEPIIKSAKTKTSSGLPPDFFDNHDAKRPKNGLETIKSVEMDSHGQSRGSIQSDMTESLLSNEMDGSLTKNNKHAGDIRQATTENPVSETNKVKGALPEGFFDNKEADLRARGVKLVKPDVKDEYKEFEKLIQEDLKEVDDRLEEEEIDAAEMIEEAETLEQKAYREKVELLRKKKMELMAARSVKKSENSGVSGKASGPKDSSSDDDDDEEEEEEEDGDDNFAVDWRAQHL